ncbi:hypothetical protein BDV28DRAFT_48409 [Aspergillus coremiiformis]|uniref:Uncharacterized protein n=1 Tax=Aspergillus coremiiformis TaxID=138285 RepID=A0A5N6ZDR4_9EURO|nr:hypothetical protein BDV28DRAFT_48409 [Aspergillus coremiiformis]
MCHDHYHFVAGSAAVDGWYRIRHLVDDQLGSPSLLRAPSTTGFPLMLLSATGYYVFYFCFPPMDFDSSWVFLLEINLTSGDIAIAQISSRFLGLICTLKLPRYENHCINDACTTVRILTKRETTAYRRTSQLWYFSEGCLFLEDLHCPQVVNREHGIVSFELRYSMLTEAVAQREPRTDSRRVQQGATGSPKASFPSH